MADAESGFRRARIVVLGRGSTAERSVGGFPARAVFARRSESMPSRKPDERVSGDETGATDFATRKRLE